VNLTRKENHLNHCVVYVTKYFSKCTTWRIDGIIQTRYTHSTQSGDY